MIMKFIKFIVIIAVVFFAVCILLLAISWNIYLRQDPPPYSSFDRKEGFFPLHEADFSKTISMEKHPIGARFFIFIETPSPIEPRLDDVVLKIEAIKDGHVIGSHLIQGSTFYKFGKPEPTSTHLYAIFSSQCEKLKSVPDSEMRAFYQKEGATDITLRYFKEREPATYRITVVQPCEMIPNIHMELQWSGSF